MSKLFTIPRQCGDKSDTSYIFAEGDEWGQQIWHCPLSQECGQGGWRKKKEEREERWMEKLSETEAGLEIEQEGWVKFSQTG